MCSCEILDEYKKNCETGGHTLILWNNSVFVVCHRFSMMDHTTGIPSCLNPSELFKMDIFGYTEIYIINIFINQSVVTDIGGYFWK